MRTLLQRLHRWIGLTLGLVLALICLSGAALLFQSQFFRWAHGDLIPPGLSPQMGSIDAWKRNADAAVPGVKGPFYMWAPQVSHNISDAGMLLYAGKPGGLGKLGYTAVLVAPASGDVLGVVNVDSSPAYAPIFLHGRLWAGKTGIVVVAIIAIGTVLLLAIGLYLWWPRQRLLRKLSPLPWRNTFLYAGRLHDWSGAWSLLLLLVVAVTGLYMARADWLAPVINLLPATPAHAQHESAPCSGPIAFDRAVSEAKRLTPGTELIALESTDYDPGLRHWRLVFRPSGSRAVTRQTHVVADLECGTVVLAGSPGARAPRDSAEMMLEGLHDGTLFGFPGQLFMSLVGLIPLVLAWTGVVRWLAGRRLAQRSAAAANLTAARE